MICIPALGDVVDVWPSPGLRVREFAGLDRFLPQEGSKCVWTPWLAERFRDGSVHITDPRGKSAPPAAAQKAVSEKE